MTRFPATESRHSRIVVSQGTPSALVRSRIRGLAAFAPLGRLTNADLERLVDTSDEWILKRTGINQRSIAAPNEFTSDLALRAIELLAESVGSLDDVDFIIVATSTADYVFPSVAAQLQAAMGLERAGAIDLGAACAGFVYALNVGDALVTSGQAKRVLIVGAEVMTKALDYTDRATCILFGDGAGVVLLEPGDATSHVECSSYGSEGEGARHLYRTAIRKEIAGATDESGLLRQSGQDVYKWAVRRIPDVIASLLASNNLTAADIDWFVPHSANLRIIESICERTGISRERTLTSIEEFGNTSTASIPLALAPAVADGRVKRGDRVLMVSFGGGLVYAGAIVRW